MALPEKWVRRVTELVGEKYVVSEGSTLEAYAHDEFALESIAVLPRAVVMPGSESEVADVVRACADHGIAVTARGGGTGLSGGCNPAPEGVVISLGRLNRVVDTDTVDRTIAVQAGMTLQQLYAEVKQLGLFFPPHPGDEGAFVGGAVAANAGGARAVKYGTVRRFVCGMRVVLPDGSVSVLGGKLLKSSTGYHLKDLFIGSEGTLGIITEVTLSLMPPPAYSTTLVAPFDSIHNAIEAVPAIMQSGSIPCAVEFIEHTVLKCAEKKLNRSWPARSGTASLMIILDGKSEETVMEDAEALAGVLEEAGAGDVLVAEESAKQAEILEMRSILYEALREATVELFDICVPVSQIAGHVDFVHELEQRHGCCLPTYGHAADGNVHTHSLRRKLADGEWGEELPNWEHVHETVRGEIYRDAIARGGVISGEHGIGTVKRDFLIESVGEVQVELMRRIKKAIDPRGIMNPGKVV